MADGSRKFPPENKRQDKPAENPPANQTRSEVKEVLGAFGVIKPHSFAELIEKLGLEVQYGECLITLKRYGFLDDELEVKKDDAKLPSLERTISSFSAEELEIASHFQQPDLLLVPENSFASKIKALDDYMRNTLKMEPDCIDVAPVYHRIDSGSDKITGWRAVIVEGAREIETQEGGDELKLKLGERIKNRKSARRPGEKGMNMHIYAMLAMKAIENGRFIDEKFRTILDDDIVPPAIRKEGAKSSLPNILQTPSSVPPNPSSVPPPSVDAAPATYVLRANFFKMDNAGLLRFDWSTSGLTDEDMRFRSSVGGEDLLF